jgi:hypothetical protein
MLFPLLEGFWALKALWIARKTRKTSFQTGFLIRLTAKAIGERQRGLFLNRLIKGYLLVKAGGPEPSYSWRYMPEERENRPPRRGRIDAYLNIAEGDMHMKSWGFGG